MRVVIVASSISRLGGGVSESARLQVKALKGGKIECTVLTLKDRYFEVDRCGWGAVAIRSFRSFGPKGYRVAPGLLLALLRSKPDIVHVHGVWQYSGMAVYLWSLLSGRPYIVTPHGMLERWIRARSPRLKWLVSKLYQDRFLRRAAAFQLLTEKEREDVAEFLQGQPAAFIPNYVPRFARDEAAPVWWRSEFAGRDIYLFLGRIHEKKGCMELCDAWDRLCEERNEFRNRSVLVFCGWVDGLLGFESCVRDLAARHGNAFFAGSQYGSDKARTLSVTDYFVLPSKSEGLPIAVLEAWSASVPVIMTEDCNLSDGFARDAAIRCGSNPDSILAALDLASQLPADRRREIAGNGRRLVEESYSAEGVRRALLQAYHGAIDSWKARR